MPLAARVNEPTAHPGAVSGPGVANVMIGGRPAAVQGDIHCCAFPPPTTHPPSPFPKGSATVLIGGRGALRQGDTAGCGAPIVAGCLTVLTGG
ncbi:PAAR domain-containing protein [Streptomyces sp. NBC_00453]|uniref:PAAR domain-containing protein n=1 Tax=Streptomyces sp. NBC_00453 TaxID=2903653 RepID=UPI002E1DB98B